MYPAWVMVPVLFVGVIIGSFIGIFLSRVLLYNAHTTDMRATEKVKKATKELDEAASLYRKMVEHSQKSKV